MLHVRLAADRPKTTALLVLLVFGGVAKRKEPWPNAKHVLIPEEKAQTLTNSRKKDPVRTALHSAISAKVDV